MYQTYSKTLFETAIEKKMSPENLTRMIKELESFKDWVDHSQEAKKVFLGCLLKSNEKIKLISKIVQKLNFLDLTGYFLQLLCKKNRVFLLDQVISHFKELCLSLDGKQLGKLFTAVSIPESEVKYLEKLWSEKIKKTMSFEVNTDPSLIVGMKLVIAGVTYEYTLKSQLKKLQESFISYPLSY